MKLLLDTSAYSQLARGNPEVTGLVRRAEQLLLSTFVVGELLAGFRGGSRFEENAAELERFAADPRVSLLTVTWTTADRYSRVAVALKRRGTPIPTNDIWIAAQALETGSELLSSDSHFGAVDGLAWIPFSLAVS